MCCAALIVQRECRRFLPRFNECHGCTLNPKSQITKVPKAFGVTSQEHANVANLERATAVGIWDLGFSDLPCDHQPVAAGFLRREQTCASAISDQGFSRGSRRAAPTATPAEQVSVTSRPGMRRGIGVAETVLRISSSLAAASATLVSMKASANSSPPNRAHRSVRRTVLRQTRTDLAQHFISRERARRIVDAPELVEIDERERERPHGAGTLRIKSVAETLLEMRAGQQPREIVADR